MIKRVSPLKSAILAAVLATFPVSYSSAHEPTPVVATFSILGDMVAAIGGDHIELTTLVDADGDAHVYQPTPADAKAVAGAKVLFVNGLEFEGWLERLSQAADFKGDYVVATAGIDPIPFEDGHDDHHDDHDDHGHDDHAHKDDHGHDDHGHDDHAHKDDHGHDDHGHDDHAHKDDHGHDDHGHDNHAHKDDHGHDDHGHAHHGHDHGEFDPHAWQSVANAIVYVDNITAALSKADPEHADLFAKNRDAYVAELQALEAEIVAMMDAIPEARRTVVTSHDAFGYFEASYGLTFKAPQGLSTDSEASASDVARMIEQIREEGISALFVETVTDNRLLEQIARETGANIGGTLYADALSGPDGPASTYIDMMRYNAKTLAGALGS